MARPRKEYRNGYMVQGQDARGVVFTGNTFRTLAEARKGFKADVQEALEYQPEVAEIYLWPLVDFVPETQYDPISSWRRVPIE